MTRYECTRCGEECFTTNSPHLCRDIVARLKRREAQKAAVVDILRDPPGAYLETVAEAIVTKLAAMGVEKDY